MPARYPVGTSVPKALRRVEHLMSVRLKWILLIKLYFMYISHVVFVTYIGPWGLAEG